MDSTSLPAATLTGHERRIAEAYVVVLDYESRLALAVEHGDWFYLADKAGELEQAAHQLAKAALAGHRATPIPRAAAVRAVVANRCACAGYRAGALLHPLRQGATCPEAGER
jgi:hypothetical protein